MKWAPNLLNLCSARAGQWHSTWSGVLSSSSHFLQVLDSPIPNIRRCLFRWQCPVNSSTNLSNHQFEVAIFAVPIDVPRVSCSVLFLFGALFLNAFSYTNLGWGPKVWTTKNQNGLNLENKNYERLNVERPLLPTTFNARDQKFERLKWREVKN